MPFRFHRLQEVSSAALDRCKNLEVTKFLPGSKSKDQVTQFTSAAPTVGTTSSGHADKSYDHLLALLSIPAESDTIPRRCTADIPGVSFPGGSDAVDETIRVSYPRQESRGTGRVQNFRCQELDNSGNSNQNDLVMAAKDALSRAKADGVTFPWEEQRAADEEQSDEKVPEEVKTDPFEQALALEARLQAWERFANADLVTQNRLRHYLGLPAAM
eukprot:TRINITY_DN18475_c0_g1_i1.p1 TRINITY_DN18475_c0_g1~~TRINITY_DN18475_c0_g1_i1.p1  ORF type:complete len:234 (+),score=40.77 TRINITY_DN18475_c0_g1_i1:60-704(+)